ncbi:MAG: glycoside hydrolase family 15 protein [Chloroflexia bacterium]
MIHPLHTKSIQIIKANQTPGGAYLASPSFPVYNYCWFRDSAYIAYAMDLVGEHHSAMRFYNWAAATIADRANRVERTVNAIAHGTPPTPDDLLDTRYTVEGKEDETDWPNFQLDGFGTLLWGMSQHLSLTNQTLRDMSPEWVESIALLVRYLGALWSSPCYDCWEEFGDKIHTATLASLYGGLQSASAMLMDVQRGVDALAASESALLIRRFVLENCVIDGALAKFVGNSAVDANLIHVSVPYNLLTPEDPIMRRTAERIQSELRTNNDGVHRYTDDSYYGGGEWILLTAYLGWYYTKLGDHPRAQQTLDWIESSADPDLQLPEQLHCHLNHPEKLAEWQELWGPIAKPLLWSHAAYLTLQAALTHHEK